MSVCDARICRKLWRVLCVKWWKARRLCLFVFIVCVNLVCVVVTHGSG